MTYTAYPPAAPNNQAILSSQSEAVSHVDISEQSAGSWETVMYWSFRVGKLKLRINRVGNWLGYYFFSLRTRLSNNQEGGTGKSAGVEVYTVPGMQAHFRLAFFLAFWCVFIGNANRTEQSSRFASF